jgi:hypothetical protein
MMANSSRPVWVHTLRYGLMFAAAGLFIAITLFFLGNWGPGFPEWGVLLWPTAVLMLGLSTYTGSDFVIATLEIIASNAVLYFLIATLVTPPTILIRRLIGRVIHRHRGR